MSRGTCSDVCGQRWACVAWTQPVNTGHAAGSIGGKGGSLACGLGFLAAPTLFITHASAHARAPHQPALLPAGQWEMLRRSLRMNLRQFDRTLHVGLGAILLGGFLTFEYVHGAVWRLHNAGVS